MKKSDGEGPFPNAQLPTMQIDALDPAQDISLEDPDVAATSEPSIPPRSRATPPPLPPEASVPPPAPQPSPVSYAPPPPQKKASMGLLLGATLGALVVGGGIVALVVRSQTPEAPQPSVSVVQTSAPAPSASAASSAGVMTIPVIEFDDDKK